MSCPLLVDFQDVDLALVEVEEAMRHITPIEGRPNLRPGNPPIGDMTYATDVLTETGIRNLTYSA